MINNRKKSEKGHDSLYIEFIQNLIRSSTPWTQNVCQI